MLIHTAEVRWFYPGEVPDTVARWFDESGLARRFPPRTDRYLVLPGSTAVGVKIREGRFELKGRTDVSRQVALPNESAGMVEGWVKWIAPFRPEIDWIQRAGAVEVRKERTIRGYRSEGGTPRVVDLTLAGAWCDCRAELSRLGVREEAWWTLAFEASGERAELDELLDDVLTRAFRDAGPPVPLELDASTAYPAFLQRWTI